MCLTLSQLYLLMVLKRSRRNLISSVVSSFCLAVAVSRSGSNCIKIGLPVKSILRDYFQENRTSGRPFLLLRISVQGSAIFIQLIPVLPANASTILAWASWASWSLSSSKRYILSLSADFLSRQAASHSTFWEEIDGIVISSFSLLISLANLQRGASDHSQGFKDNNLGSSPGLLGQ